MPKASSYAQRTRKLTIEFEDHDDDPLHLSYYPRAITPKMEIAFTELEQSGKGHVALYDALRVLIASWDLTDDDGIEIPRTPEALEDLPSQVLLRVSQAIIEDIRPNAKRSSISPNGSDQTASGDRARIGSSFSD